MIEFNGVSMRYKTNGAIALDNVNVKIVMPDASTKAGLGEAALSDLEVGDVVQFERVGFARLDEITDDELIFYYAHK